MAYETGKTRSQRIEIDYYRKPSGLSRWRTACVIAACIISALYAFYALAIASPESQLSTGPVAKVHASFEDDCQQCHIEFTPIAEDSKAINLPSFGILAADTLAKTESKCQSCHQVGEHHRDIMNADAKDIDRNCAGCHYDHMGRDFDMVAIANDKCTHCHGQLSNFCQGELHVRSDIAAFTSDQHGNFQSLGLTEKAVSDPGRIKFDHAQHMRPGQVEAGQRGGTTLAMLPEADQSRYGFEGQTDDALVQLECASCHQFDGQPDDQSLLISDPELGRHIAPIDFESHCMACHPILPVAATKDTPVLPHAAPWQQVDLLVAAIAKGQSELNLIRALGDDTQQTAKPGEGNGTTAMPPGGQTSSVPPHDADWLREAIQDQCLLCHDDDALQDETITEAMMGLSPPMIPPRWLQKGLYDHAAHREIDCRYCHSQAYGDDQADGGGQSHAPEDNEVIMIGGIETCVGCHRDAETPTPAELVTDRSVGLFGATATWASDDCIMCHRYHMPVPSTDRMLELSPITSLR